MYKIGEFAKLLDTSIRTLRFYDSIDLFKPDDIDLFTGYRYYSEKKIEEFKLILQLKNLGFSLEEIKANKDHLTDKVMLQKKEELLHQRKDLNKKIKQLDEMRLSLGKKPVKVQDVKVLRKF